MFGFVTFQNSETVQMILSKGNPHYVCGARVLVKPYREKLKLFARKYFEKFEAPLCYNSIFSSGLFMRAAFWPGLPGCVITALIISQVLLMGLLSTKHAAASTPVLLALPVLTMGFHIYCKGRFEPAFTRYPLQEAMNKDTLDRVKEPNLSLNLKGYLEHAYIHPVFKDDGSDDHYEDGTPIVPTKRHTHPEPSKTNEEILQEKHKP
ncbi:putative RNA-binding domain superfamily [Helianthus anomalus]